MQQSDERRIHECVDVIGFRAQATSVGLIQLCAELADAGVLEAAALERIKEAIFRDLALSRPRAMSRESFDGWVHGQLDNLFADSERRPS